MAFYLGVALWAGSQFVDLSTKVERWLRAGASLVVLFQIGIWLQVAIQRAAETWARTTRRDLEGASQARLRRRDAAYWEPIALSKAARAVESVYSAWTRCCCALVSASWASPSSMMLPVPVW